MNRTVRCAAIGLLLVLASCAPGALAQQPVGAEPQGPTGPVPVPRLVKFSGTLVDAQERPLAGTVGVTFALYAQQTGGAALWLETQNVKPDGTGSYTVLLGANSANGLPAELFASGEARWLGIQVGQQPERERILLVSVPYALKAGDAETLGGKPASAFLTTESFTGGSNSGPGTATATAAGTLPKSGTAGVSKNAATTQAACASVTSDGNAAVSSVALFTTACNVESSVITQSGGNVGIGTAAPAVALDVAGSNSGLRLSGAGTHQVTVTGASSGRLGQDANGFFFASDTNGSNVRFLTNNGALHEWMRITGAGNVGIGTTTPAAKLDLLGSNSTEILNVTQNGTGPAATFSGAANHLFDIIGTGGQAQINMIGPQTILTLNSTIAPPNAFSNLTFSHSGIVKWFITTNPGFANENQLGFIDGSGINRLTLDPTGNVGIGTATPAATLDVAGTANFSGNTTNPIVHVNQSGNGVGLSGTSSTNVGVDGIGVYGVRGTATSVNGAGVAGIVGAAGPLGSAGGIFVDNGAGTLAGQFNGNVNVSGTLTKGAGSFKIDHPLDPANKYLSHSFVESPDMMNIYNGVIVLDGHGQAWVVLPDWFEALNRDFRYQLTALGAPAPTLYVAREVKNNRFKIAGGRPHGKVSWQVTGIRHDSFADAHRIQVEEEKPGAERGHYLHPELFGQPDDQGIGVVHEMSVGATSTGEPH